MRVFQEPGCYELPSPLYREFNQIIATGTSASTHSALRLPSWFGHIEVGLAEVPIDQEAAVFDNQNISDTDIPMQDPCLFVGVFMR
jgi:hypothetical protein